MMNGNRKWEYTMETVGWLAGRWQLEKLNKMGDEGWEAVGVFLSEKASYVLLKREKFVGQTMVPSPPPSQVAGPPTCPTCGQRLTFVEQYGKWYCYNCRKYP